MTARQNSPGAFLRTIDSQPILLLGLIIAFLAALHQLPTPMIAHDDFDWLIRPGEYAGFATPWSKTLNEGRWIGFLWSKLSYKLSITTSYLLFMALYLTWSIGAASVLADSNNRRFSVAAATTIFLSPLMGEVSLWPTVSIPGMFIALLAVLVMMLGRYVSAAVPVLIYLSVFAYPPVAAMIFLLSIAMIREWTLPRFLIENTKYYCAFALAVFSIFLLNYVFHETFGIVPDTWRHPNPVRSLSDLAVNLTRHAGALTKLWDGMRWALIAGAAAYAACLWLDIRRKTCLALLAAGLGLALADATIAVSAGVVMPSRSVGWLWIFLCAPAIFLLHEGKWASIGALCLAVCATIGMLRWSSIELDGRVAVASDALAYRISHISALHDTINPNVVTFGAVREIKSLSALYSNRAMALYLWKKHRIRTTRCEDLEMCDAIKNHIDRNDVDDGIFILNDRLVLVYSPNNRNYW